MPSPRSGAVGRGCSRSISRRPWAPPRTTALFSPTSRNLTIELATMGKSRREATNADSVQSGRSGPTARRKGVRQTHPVLQRLTSCTIQLLPSGSLNDANDP